MNLKSSIRTVVDYPVEGVRFRDITTLLKNPEAVNYCVDQFHGRYKDKNIDRIAVIEARGFVFGSALAYLLKVPLVLIRKQGKLPAETVKTSYELEYGESRLEVHKDAIDESDRVVIVDDVIATGGTLNASIELVELLGACTVECATVIELIDLGGRGAIAPVSLFNLIAYQEEEI